jgi:phenylalanyl-tRNA synthetase beta chain
MEISTSDSDGGAKSVVLGHIGEVHPDVAKEYGIDMPLFAAELDFEAMLAASDMTRHYTPLRRYPAVTRDIALLADDEVAVADIEKIAAANGGDLLESVGLFDVYRGEQIEDGKKSLAFNLVYRSGERTLTDEEVNQIHARILKEIEGRTGATLREV